MKDAAPLRQFILTVPTSNDVLHARIEAGFSETYEEAEHVDLRNRVAARNAHGKNCPDDLNGWNPDGGTNTSEQHV